MKTVPNHESGGRTTTNNYNLLQCDGGCTTDNSESDHAFLANFPAIKYKLHKQ